MPPYGKVPFLPCSPFVPVFSVKRKHVNKDWEYSKRQNRITVFGIDRNIILGVRDGDE